MIYSYQFDEPLVVYFLEKYSASGSLVTELLANFGLQTQSLPRGRIMRVSQRLGVVEIPMADRAGAYAQELLRRGQDGAHTLFLLLTSRVWRGAQDPTVVAAAAERELNNGMEGG